MNRIAIAALVVTTAAYAPFARAERLTVEDAVQKALAQSPGLEAAHARQEAASAQADSLRGRFLPSIHLEEEAQHYNAPYALAFALAPGAPALNFPVRDIDTNTFVAAVGQPILELLKLSQNHGALLAGAMAAGEQAKSVESMIREAVQSGFLRYFEARALIDIAKTSEQQLAEQRQVAESKLKAGVLTKADLLRLEVAEANARQQQIQAESQESITRTALLVGLGYPPNEQSVEFVEPTQLENIAVPQTTVEAAQNAALENRHEVLKARRDAEAADHQSWASLYSFLPSADFEAVYTHLTGQVFAPVDSAFVGIKLDWAIWEWGATFYDHRAAESNARAARLMAEEQARQVRIDASTKLSQLMASASAVGVAKTAIESAEEAYRVTEALVKAGAATTTDLLDSQSALTQAKLNLVRATYEQAVANVALTRATGG